MIRWLLASLVALMLGIMAAVAVLKDNGYILIGYDAWTVESSLALFILLNMILFGVLYAVIRFLVRLWKTPTDIKTWHHHRQLRLARKSLTQGLLQMAEGDWKGAEKRLLKHAANAETPLLNYLAAARAAQLQGAHERRDSYLQLAHESMPSADVAVGLTQAELQLAHQQLEQALATLNHLKNIAPKHIYVLKLLSELYQQLDDWKQLKALLPELKKRKACNPDELEKLETRVHQYSLQQGAARDIIGLEHAWKQIPRAQRRNSTLVIDYARHLLSLDENDKAIHAVDQHIKQQQENSWNEDLLGLFGNINAEDASAQLSVAEKWLKFQPGNAALLFMLGRLSLKAKLWGKARSYLESSLDILPTSHAFHELGNLLDQMGENDLASDCYKKGLNMNSKTQPIELPANIVPQQSSQEEEIIPMPTDRNPPPAKLGVTG